MIFTLNAPLDLTPEEWACEICGARIQEGEKKWRELRVAVQQPLNSTCVEILRITAMFMRENSLDVTMPFVWTEVE